MGLKQLTKHLERNSYTSYTLYETSEVKHRREELDKVLPSLSHEVVPFVVNA